MRVILAGIFVFSCLLGAVALLDAVRIFERLPPWLVGLADSDDFGSDTAAWTMQPRRALMATDYALMVDNLMSFYDFKDKTLVSIGAGGGQFIDYGQLARRIVAIDQDATALDQLRVVVAKGKMSDKFEFVHADFLTMTLPARVDVALFDFCLHEMADVALALTRAGILAPDVVVFDHGRASEWAYYVVEDVKVDLSWKTLECFKVAQRREFTTEQKFRDHDELLAKVRPQGEIAIQRIEKFKGRTDITIPMTYELALVQFT